MRPLTRTQQLEKQNRDLRIRLENRNGKAELALSAVYDELNELRIQLRARDETIAMLQAGYTPLIAENETLRQQNESLQAENTKLSDALDKSEDRAARLAAMLKKDSSTSSKAPSTDYYFNKAKAENIKEKSGKKIGGQPGHKGRNLKPSPTPDDIIDKMPPEACLCCGGKVSRDGSYESRQMFDLLISVKVTEERAHNGRCSGCGIRVDGEFSEGFNGPVVYGPSIRAVVATLNADANVTVNKVTRFISNMTDGKIKMSDGTVINIITDLAERLDESVKDIIMGLAACGVLNVDETGVRVCGKLTWMQIISSDYFSLYGRSLKRGTLNDEMNGLILMFTGILVHDHLSSYYGYTHVSHAECNVHILRYLKAVTEIMKHLWAKEMTDLLKEANKRKKELIDAEYTTMDKNELENFRNRFNRIIDNGRTEYEAAIKGKKNITYYDEERRLLTRLNKFIDEHLRFIYDFDAPFSNNAAEHGARHIKGKKKASGGFRSDSGMDNYAVIASVAATLRKQGKSVFSAFRDAFCGNSPRFDDQLCPDTS